MKDKEFDLAVVMPVYNEEECIVAVVQSWLGELAKLGTNYIFYVINDGSRDSTKERLEFFAGSERVIVVNKQNSGHGPTILEGYHLAVEKASWVFQTDSDNEMEAVHFRRLWDSRDEFDALFGYRSGRLQGIGRWMISSVSRMATYLLFGQGVRDVNTPYRLLRSEYLGPIIENMPGDTFAPNVIISGCFSRAKLRICNLPIPHQGRKTGSVSIVKWRLLRVAIKAFFQTVRFAFSKKARRSR